MRNKTSDELVAEYRRKERQTPGQGFYPAAASRLYQFCDCDFDREATDWQRRALSDAVTLEIAIAINHNPRRGPKAQNWNHN